MKKINSNSLKNSTTFSTLFTWFFGIIILIGLTANCNDDEPDPFQFDLVGKWVLKSAIFTQPVDLDGPGVMQPTSDAKSLLHDLMGFYNECASIEDIPIWFSSELKEGVTGYFKIYLVCPIGQGNPDPIELGNYYIDKPANNKSFFWEVGPIHDPMNLIDLEEGTNMWWYIEDYSCDNNSCTISGKSGLISSISRALDLSFSFTFEMVD